MNSTHPDKRSIPRRLSNLNIIKSICKARPNILLSFFNPVTIPLSPICIEKTGGYGSSPFGEDRVVGSVLKIDNVVLNYDYE